MDGEEFLKIRLGLGLTQEECAQVLGVSSYRVVGRYERQEEYKAGGNRGSIPGPVAQIMRAMKAGFRPPNWPKKSSSDPEPSSEGEWRKPVVSLSP